MSSMDDSGGIDNPNEDGKSYSSMHTGEDNNVGNVLWLMGFSCFASCD